MCPVRSYSILSLTQYSRDYSQRLPPKRSPVVLLNVTHAENTNGIKLRVLDHLRLTLSLSGYRTATTIVVMYLSMSCVGSGATSIFRTWAAWSGTSFTPDCTSPALRLGWVLSKVNWQFASFQAVATFLRFVVWKYFGMISLGSIHQTCLGLVRHVRYVFLVQGTYYCVFWCS